MIMNSIGRVSLVSAAIAVSAFRAAAQTDAAFASALGDIPSGLATMAELKTEPQRPVGAGLSAEWLKTIAAVRKSGACVTEPNTPLVTCQLEDTVEENYGRMIYHISITGVIATDGTFKMTSAQMTNTRMASGEPNLYVWNVKIYHLSIDASGEPTKRLMDQYFENIDGSIEVKFKSKEVGVLGRLQVGAALVHWSRR